MPGEDRLRETGEIAGTRAETGTESRGEGEVNPAQVQQGLRGATEELAQLNEQLARAEASMPPREGVSPEDHDQSSAALAVLRHEVEAARARLTELTARKEALDAGPGNSPPTPATEVSIESTTVVETPSEINALFEDTQGKLNAKLQAEWDDMQVRHDMPAIRTRLQEDARDMGERRLTQRIRQEQSSADYFTGKIADTPEGPDREALVRNLEIANAHLEVFKKELEHKNTPEGIQEKLTQLDEEIKKQERALSEMNADSPESARLRMLQDPENLATAFEKQDTRGIGDEKWLQSSGDWHATVSRWKADDPQSYRQELQKFYHAAIKKRNTDPTLQYSLESIHRKEVDHKEFLLLPSLRKEREQLRNKYEALTVKIAA